MQILLEKTDENNIMSAQAIMDLLESRYGITSDRKSIYNDLELLEEYGIDIVKKKGNNPGVYIASRDFELPELKLLVDAVQSSKFITAKKSEQLINKLKKLTNENMGKQLQRQVYIHNRIKTDNETIYYNVDEIHTAIFNNRQIRFQYTEWNVRGEQQLRRNGEFYIVSPWALTWDDENYYLVAFEKSSEKIKYFRVDKMRKIEAMDEPRLGAERFQDFDLGEFSRKTFGMFDGTDEHLVLLCENKMIGVVIDRFGRDIRIQKHDENHVKIYTTVTLSSQFYGWLTGVGNEIQILEPSSAREEYLDYIKNVLTHY